MPVDHGAENKTVEAHGRNIPRTEVPCLGGSKAVDEGRITSEKVIEQSVTVESTKAQGSYNRHGCIRFLMNR